MPLPHTVHYRMVVTVGKHLTLFGFKSRHIWP